MTHAQPIPVRHHRRGRHGPADTSVARALVRRGHEVRILADRVLAPDVEVDRRRARRLGHRAAATRTSSREHRHPRLGRQDAARRVRRRSRRPDDGPGGAGSPPTCAPSCAVAPPTSSSATSSCSARRSAPRPRASRSPCSCPTSRGCRAGACRRWARDSRRPPARSGACATPPPRAPCPGASTAASRSSTRPGARTALAPIDHVLDSYDHADRILVLTSAAFDYDELQSAPNVRVTGPRLDDPVWAGDWTLPPGDDPLVLVGLSSTFMDQAKVLRRIARRARRSPGARPDHHRSVDRAGAIGAPPNVTVVERAPHSEVLRHAAAVVTHGGHGTVIKTLAAGVPLVVMPIGRDQPDNAARVVHHGAGLRVRPSARTGAITRAVRRILRGSRLRRRGATPGRGAIATDLADRPSVAELEALPAGDGRRREPAAATV